MSSISPQYSNRAEIADQYRAQQAEKEDIQAQNEAEINNLKRSYEAEKQDLKDRFEASLQADKANTYEHLRNAKAQLNREERMMDSLQSQAMDQKKHNYALESIRTEREGRSELQNLSERYHEAEEYQRNQLNTAENEIRTNHKKTAEGILTDSQNKLNALKQEKQEFLEKQQATHAQALDQIQDHYQGIRNQQVETYQNDIQNVAHKISADLNSRKLAGATYVQKYDSKSADPFYQIQRFDSDLLDIGEAYVLRVKVPQYERKQFRIQLSGQELQLAGARTSDESLKLEPGRTVSTKSYQNITERYKLDTPVDARAMTQREDGDWMEYTIPKFSATHRIADQYQKSPYTDDPKANQELTFIKSLPTPTIPRKPDGNSGNA